jgi:hypothetical protein
LLNVDTVIDIQGCCNGYDNNIAILSITLHQANLLANTSFLSSSSSLKIKSISILEARYNHTVSASKNDVFCIFLSCKYSLGNLCFNVAYVSLTI